MIAIFLLVVVNWLEDEALEEGGCICIDVHCVLIMAFQCLVASAIDGFNGIVNQIRSPQVGRSLTNPLSSPLKHTAWLLLVLAWSFLAIGLVVANFIIKAMKTT